MELSFKDFVAFENAWLLFNSKYVLYLKFSAKKYPKISATVLNTRKILIFIFVIIK